MIFSFFAAGFICCHSATAKTILENWRFKRLSYFRWSCIILGQIKDRRGKILGSHYFINCQGNLALMKAGWRHMNSFPPKYILWTRNHSRFKPSNNMAKLLIIIKSKVVWIVIKVWGYNTTWSYGDKYRCTWLKNVSNINLNPCSKYRNYTRDIHR